MSSSTLLGVRLSDTGVPILREGAGAEERAAFFKLFWESSTGQRFRPLATKKNQALLDEYLEKKFPDAIEVTLAQFEHLVTLMLDTHTFVSQQSQTTTALVEDTRPRDAQGRFLSEFEIWANAPERSSAEIHSRVRNDAAFATWYRAELTAQTIQDGTFKIAGAPTREATDDDYRTLCEFVELYRLAPAASLKPKSGYITLGNMKLTPQQFEILISSASDAGLI